jgi:hypothetical protein
MLVVPVLEVAVVLAVFASRHGYPFSARSLDSIGVVDFYMAGPTQAISGVDVERFAADDLAALLPKVERHPVKIIDRAVLREAEASMKWRRADITSLDRLGELARRVGAVHLATGRIERFYMEREGRSEIHATVKIRVQIFDAIHGRLAPGAAGDGFARGATQQATAQQALRQANAHALPGALSNMSVRPAAFLRVQQAFNGGPQSKAKRQWRDHCAQVSS